MIRAHRMGRIDEELVCIDSLRHQLIRHCSCRRVDVQREKDDPPDFWVHVDGRKYAAEVTSITIAAENACWAACCALEKAVGDAATTQQCLSGTYVLSVHRKPDLPRRTSADWCLLVKKAVSYLRRVAAKQPAGESILLTDEQGRVSIRKVSTGGAAVRLVHLPEAKWEGEIHEELQGLVQNAVTTKRAKLEKKRVRAKCAHVILVLYDAYGFADMDDVRRALLDMAGYEWFHSVFWAASFTDRRNELFPEHPGRHGVFLYSRDPDWGNAQRTPRT